MWLKDSRAQPLQQAANSIVCTDAGPLLNHVFNMTPSIARPLTFPSRACTRAQLRCEACTRRNVCPTTSALNTMSPSAREWRGWNSENIFPSGADGMVVRNGIVEDTEKLGMGNDEEVFFSADC